MKFHCTISCLLLAAMIWAVPAAAIITGSSTASNCGEGGNWIDITFTTDEGVSLVDAWWDFNGTSVWLDADGYSMCEMINNGVTSFNFYFDGPVGDDTQDFGSTFTGFGSGDYFRFVMDLDLGSTGMPYGADYMGGTVTVEFSDATILVATFDTLYDGSSGATASFDNAPSLPNFEFVSRPDWYDVIVPSSETDAIWTNVPAPDFLIGETDSTWISACYGNTGESLAGSSRMNLHLDGSFIGYRTLFVIEPGAWNGPINAGPYTVPGGRHVLRVTADALNQVSESDETDNVHVVQFCWQGDYLAPLASETRSAPPDHDQDFQYGLSGWWNCDGVRVTPSPSYDWCAVWCERESDTGYNYMLRLHPPSDDPEDAFGTNLGASRAYDNLHAMLINTHTMGGGSWDVGVLNLNNVSDDYRISHLHESPYPFDFGIEPTSPYFVSRLAMFQFHVGPGDLGPATLTAYSDPEDGPVRMGWLLPDFTTGNLDDLLDEVVTDSEGCAKINLDLTVTGEYCAVVYGNRAEHPGGLAVNVGLYHGLPDLEPVTLTGWYAPIVPRPDDGSALFNCPLPDTLHGHQPLTWMNLAGKNDGPAVSDITPFGIEIDGVLNYTISSPADWAPGAFKNIQNIEIGGSVPWQIRGGRHTLTSRLDFAEQVDECVERNNDSGRQYCWSPLVLPTNASLAFAGGDILFDRTGGWETCDGGQPLYWNCDGLRMPYIPPIGGNRWWIATAVMPWSTALDIDLQLHVPLSGTQDGFGPNVLAESMWGDGQVEFVLVNDRSADNRPHDVGVLDDVDDYVPGYTAQEARSTWGGIPGRGEMGPYPMGAGRMLNLHEYMLDEGSWLITLTDNDTGVDWGMSLYQGGPYLGKSDVVDGAIAWEAGDGVTERMLVEVPPGSSFCLAVWKVDAGELAKDGSYSLWLAPGVTGTDDMPPLRPTDTRLVSASPNPFNPRTSIAFEIERDGFCHLALYDLQGRLVRTLIAEDRRAGAGDVEWDGQDDQGMRAASGIYLVRLRAAGVEDLIKVTLMK